MWIRTSTCERQSYETCHRAGLQSVMIFYSEIKTRQRR